jgi:galactonate dehydratase
LPLEDHRHASPTPGDGLSSRGLPPLIITKVQSITPAEFPNLMWVRIYSDRRPVGLGEAFVGARAMAACIHETVAPYLLGKDARQIQWHSRALYG